MLDPIRTLIPGLGCILLCLAAASLPVAAASEGTAEQALVEWVRDNGGEVNAAIAALPQGGRSIMAPRDFVKGQVLAKVPWDITYRLTGGQETWAVKLWQDMQDPDSPLGPFFRTQPARDEVWSMYDIPETYLPLLQSPGSVVEDSIKVLQKNYLPQPDAANPQTSSAAMDGARYALALVATRQFEEAMLIPFLDMANHAQPCTTTEHIKQHCDWQPNTTVAPNAPPRICTFWLAKSNIAAGTELCTSYRYLTSDMALLQYGFLLDGPAAQQLARFDRHDFYPRNVWGEPWWDAGNPEPQLFRARNATEAAEELSRLAQLHEQLTVRDAELAASPVQPQPRDTNGRFLGMLMTWRAQRKQAVRLEIERLLKVAASFDKQEGSAGSLAES